MPKFKTHSGAKKRFKLTGSGKLKRQQANRRHYLEHKSSRSPVAWPRTSSSPRRTSRPSSGCSVSNTSPSWESIRRVPDHHKVFCLAQYLRPGGTELKGVHTWHV